MIVILLILSVLVGAFLGKSFGSREKLAKNLLVLSAGFLITICLTDVFPEVYSVDNKNIGLYVIGGVLLQMLLENLTKGFEHGHFHHQEDHQSILPVALMVGMFIHAFIEGIPLAGQDTIYSPYLLGILVHNLPISFVLGAFLFPKKISASGMMVVMLFALSSPLGIILGQYFKPQWQPYFLAVVGGIFLHIASVIIFESNKNHKMDWQKMFLVVSGVILGLLGQSIH